MPDNANGLPVGFAILKGGVDPTTGEFYEDQIGLTCAACHTGHLEYKNVSIRYDGGPAMVNLGEVERVIGLSIGHTLMLPWRFERFADRLESIEGRSVDRKKLRGDLERALQKIRKQKAANDGLLAQCGAWSCSSGAKLSSEISCRRGAFLPPLRSRFPSAKLAMDQPPSAQPHAN
ncbi:hypothetical protein [Bradyrhizobium ottawaense]|uniref:hypothetical protein n=1 Tax=Bradyrhizobium ottawaense TaxID=931866 RepID=UPI0030F41ECC